MSHDLEINKKNAMAFYEMLFNKGNPSEALKNYATESSTHHNPIFGESREEFIQYFERMAREHPGKKVIFRQTIAERDYVVLHCTQLWPASNNYEGIHIFRFGNEGKIDEHWEYFKPWRNSAFALMRSCMSLVAERDAAVQRV